MYTYDRSHVDDVSATPAHHDGQTGVNEVERRFQVDGDDGIPLCFAHAQHQAVFRDACVVDEDIHTAEVLHNLFDHLMRFVKVRRIRGISFHFHAQGRDFFFRRLCVLVDRQIGKCNVCSFRSKFQGNRFSDTSCSACHQGCLSFQ